MTVIFPGLSLLQAKNQKLKASISDSVPPYLGWVSVSMGPVPLPSLFDLPPLPALPFIAPETCALLYPDNPDVHSPGPTSKATTSTWPHPRLLHLRSLKVQDPNLLLQWPIFLALLTFLLLYLLFDIKIDTLSTRPVLFSLPLAVLPCCSHPISIFPRRLSPTVYHLNQNQSLRPSGSFVFLFKGNFCFPLKCFYTFFFFTEE